MTEPGLLSPEPPLRRHFVAIATGTYDSGEFAHLNHVGSEVNAFKEWLCDDHLGERRFVHSFPELADSPDLAQIETVFKAPKGHQWTADDALFLYITGHGFCPSGKRAHYLALRHTQADKPTSTALATSQLVAWLKELGLVHVVIVIDTCHAGATQEDISRLVDDFGPHWLVLPAAGRAETAQVGGVSNALTHALRELTAETGQKWGTREYLDVSGFVTQLNAVLPPGQLIQPLHTSQWSGDSYCLPNPHFSPEARADTGGPRRDLALLAADLEAHWAPRSRGLTRHTEDGGWLFSGRQELMRELIGRATGGPGVVIVTGGAGSGKSAVLSRLVTLSDPTFRTTYAAELTGIPASLMPPEGAVDVAVLATGKNATEVLAQICGALGVPGSEPNQPLEQLQQRWDAFAERLDEPPTIVIDALDEAADPYVVLDKVLGELVAPGGSGADPRVRLIVGVRSATHDSDDESYQKGHRQPVAARAESLLCSEPDRDRIRVDEAPWWRPGDVGGYATSLLLAPLRSPYRDCPEDTVATVARAIEAGAVTSYLVAKIAAEQLASRAEVIDPADPTWRVALRAGVLGVFREDLRKSLTDPLDRLRAVHLMRAVAFAHGRGLPWADIWPRVANAVADDPSYPNERSTYGDRDIAWLLRTRLGGYLITDEEDNVTVYRLFHDGLRQLLREDWRQLLEEAPAL